jgi:hypothetical protein
MSKLESRINRLEKRVMVTVPLSLLVDEELLRVAGKTQRQANADLIRYSHQVLAAVQESPDFPNDVREDFQKRIEKSEAEFAERFGSPWDS